MRVAVGDEPERLRVAEAHPGPTERSEPMKPQNLMTVLAAAALTVAVTLGLAALWESGAVQAVPAVKPIITQPQFTSQGCTFVLKTDQPSYEAGQSPVIEVTATNPTDKPVEASVWVSVTSTSPLSRRSRMLVLPTALWSHKYDFSLKPGESKPVSATCAAKLPAGQEVRIILGDKQAGIMATNMAVPADVTNLLQPSVTPNGGINLQGPNRLNPAPKK
jgi:hypothetical protein